MNTKKLLAVAAIALLSVPAYAAATQIVVGPVQEQVVEGHTVFAVIEKARFRNATTEAAAVAVLVREREAQRNNYKGVLWFNDQYLVSPSASASASVRYPCGGAVMAVNAGDPDPRTMLVSNNRTDVYQVLNDNGDDSQDVLSQDSDYTVFDLIGGAGPEVQTQNSAGTPGTTTPGSFQPGQNAWADVSDPDGLFSQQVNFDPANPAATTVDPGQLPTVSTVALRGAQMFNYEESYLITDPNDHSWIIDKYNGITVTSINLNNGQVVETTSTFPLWVVNILGKPVFTPDDGMTTCPPYVDDPWQQAIINENFIDADTTVCETTTTGPTATLPDSCPSAGPGFGTDVDGDGAPIDGLDARPPAIGYYEPTQTTADFPGTARSDVSYCYEGNAEPRDGDVSDRPHGMGCDHQGTYLPPTGDEQVTPFGFGFDFADDRFGNHPLRLYNALLYFYTEDCETGSNADDVRATQCFVPHNLDDTNGCQAGTEWRCPQWVDTDGDGDYDATSDDDDREGNSHPFNPPGIYVPTVFDPTGAGQIAGTGSYYDIHAANRDCSLGYDGQNDYCNPREHIEHDRGLIDLYFSPLARPIEPAFRSWAELDYEGRIDEFHENNENPNAFPGEPEHAHNPDGSPEQDVPVSPFMFV